MTMRGRAEPKNHIPLNHFFFIMDACPGHILESTKEIEMKLDL